MKRIYVILFAAALSASIFSCEEKTRAEKADDQMHETGDHANDSARLIGDETEKELKKTTENGGDAH